MPAIHMLILALCECGLFVFLFLLTFPICVFPSSFFMRLAFSSISSSISYLPEYWTRSVSRPEVVGGDQTFSLYYVVVSCIFS